MRGLPSGLFSPPLDAAPERNYHWWDALSEGDRAELLSSTPEEIGNRNGIPFAARYRTNLAVLQAYSDQVNQIAARRREESGVAGPAPGVGSGGREAELGLFQRTPEREGLLGRLEGGLRARLRLESEEERFALKHEACRVLLDVLTRGEDRGLLYFDHRGPHITAAFVTGNLDTAAHIVVVLGGVDTMIHASLGGMDDEATRLKRVMVEQQRLLRRPAEEVAIISVIYPVPRTGGAKVLAAALGWKAKPAAQRLEVLVSGIRYLRSDARLVIFGHSYGSYVVGIALKRGLRPDAVAVYGSPGLGVWRYDALRMPRGRVYALEADADIIADLGWFGRDPSRIPEIVQLSCLPGEGPDGVVRNGIDEFGASAHARYQWDNTQSQYNLAMLAAGLTDRLVLDPRLPEPPVNALRQLWELYFRHGRSRLQGELRQVRAALMGRVSRTPKAPPREG